MNEKARQIKSTTRRRLDTLSGNQCAAPDCGHPLIAGDGESIISKICHIEAANENGPRFNPEMDDDERRQFDNLILLCDECHTIIDNKENAGEYTVSQLKQWKKNHENKQLVKRKPTLLTTAINALADADFDNDEYPEDKSLQVIQIENKMAYNRIKRNRSLIDDYKIFYSKVNSLYNELEVQGSFKKKRLLRNINRIYQKIKGDYVGDGNDPIQVIRDNADNIIDDVEDTLFNQVKKEGHHLPEDIAFEISIIMVDAFIKCKILEEPVTG